MSCIVFGDRVRYVYSSSNWQELQGGGPRLAG